MVSFHTNLSIFNVYLSVTAVVSLYTTNQVITYFWYGVSASLNGNACCRGWCSLFPWNCILISCTSDTKSLLEGVTVNTNVLQYTKQYWMLLYSLCLWNTWMLFVCPDGFWTTSLWYYTH